VRKCTRWTLDFGRDKNRDSKVFADVAEEVVGALNALLFKYGVNVAPCLESTVRAHMIIFTIDSDDDIMIIVIDVAEELVGTLNAQLDVSQQSFMRSPSLASTRRPIHPRPRVIPHASRNVVRNDAPTRWSRRSRSVCWVRSCCRSRCRTTVTCTSRAPPPFSSISASTSTWRARSAVIPCPGHSSGITTLQRIW
jgi:hypothetical protein